MPTSAAPLFRTALLCAALAVAAPFAAAGSARAESTLADGPGVRFEGEEAQALRRAVEDYFWGRQQGDQERLARSFLDEGHLKGIQVENGKESLRTESLGQFRSRMSPLAEDTAGVIVDLDMADGRLAWVKLTLDSPSRFFNDYLLFYKIDGQWKLVNKMFTAQRKG